ncbi:MAG: NAD(P)H-dependent oxidoreductase subunit E [Parahaliea sp.]
MDTIRSNAAAPHDIALLVQSILTQHSDHPGALLPILHDIQDALGWIPKSLVPQIAIAVQQSRAEVHGVISFYSHFHTTPPAHIQLEICRAESCQACGANSLYEYAQAQITTGDTEAISLAPVYCLGLCSQSPAIMINGRPHAHVTPEKLDELLTAAQGV